MTTAAAASTAVVFVWLGMVLGISFLEAPLKFRASEVTLEVGLSIGRLVFRALNAFESAFAAVLLVMAAVYGPSAWPFSAVAIVALVVQLALVRPRLTQRSNRVLARENPPRSRAHYVYIALEIAKAVALLTSGIRLLVP